jgi:hypothetical protein
LELLPKASSVEMSESVGNSEDEEESYSRALQVLVNENAEDLYQSLRYNHDPLGTGLVSAAVLGKVISEHLGLTGKDVGLVLSRGDTSSFQVTANDLNARSGIPPPVKVRYQDILQAKPSPLREKAAPTSSFNSSLPSSSHFSPTVQQPQSQQSSPQMFKVQFPNFNETPAVPVAPQTQSPLQNSFGSRSALPDGGAASQRHVQESIESSMIPPTSSLLRNSSFDGGTSLTPYSRKRFQVQERSSYSSYNDVSANNAGATKSLENLDVSRLNQHHVSDQTPFLHGVSSATKMVYRNTSSITDQLNESRLEANSLRVQLSKARAIEQSAEEEKNALYNRLQASLVRDNVHKEERIKVETRMKKLQDEFK